MRMLRLHHTADLPGRPEPSIGPPFFYLSNNLFGGRFCNTPTVAEGLRLRTDVVNHRVVDAAGGITEGLSLKWNWCLNRTIYDQPLPPNSNCIANDATVTQEYFGANNQ
jgi:hypothetical protein